MLADVISIDITARMREELYWLGQRVVGNKIEIKNRMFDMWQRRWNASENGRCYIC